MGYLTVTEINQKIDELAGNADYSGYVSAHTLPNQSHEARPIKYLKIGKGSLPVLFVGGIHPREWAPPDALISLAAKLLAAYQNGTPFVEPRFVWDTSEGDSNDVGHTGRTVFERQVFPNSDVRRIIDNLELYILPCANPDGRHYSMGVPALTKRMWRKNRRPQAGACTPVGVDLNRNFPPGWNIETYYETPALNSSNTGAYVATSNDACDPIPTRRDVYQGPTAASEAETQNVINLIDSKNIRFYVDVHSFDRSILYPWGINPSQTTDNTKSFLNSSINRNTVTGAGGRQLNTTNSAARYKEYFPHHPAYNLLQSHLNVGDLMKNSIFLAAGSDIHAKNRSNYTVKSSLALYAAPGASDDYAFSKQLQASGNRADLNTSLFPVHAYTIEAGDISDGGFWPLHTPNQNQYKKVQREIHAASLGMLRFAANWRIPTISNAPSGGGGGCFSIFIMFISIGGTALVSLTFLIIHWINL